MKTFVIVSSIFVALFAGFAGLLWMVKGDWLDALTTATVLGGGLVGFVVVVVLYFAPTFVAVQRQHTSQSGIVLCNLLVGWTLIGWVVALVWAASGQHGAQRA